MRPFIWDTPGVCDLLRAMCAAGSSYGMIAREISQQFGIISRNACIGKAKRMGLSESKPVRAKAAPRRRVRKSMSTDRRKQTRVPPRGFRFNPAGPPKPPGPTDLAPDSSPCAITIMALTVGLCRWPLGDPTRDMLYCGACCEEKSAYCARHASLAYAGRVPLLGVVEVSA